MSFDRNTSNQSEPPKRSIWRTMFVPDVTGGMSGIGESLQMFVKIIAYLFALNGLFPKDHPAIQPRATRSLRLMDVLSVGWENLVFKKENMIQIIVYFSVVGTLFLTLLLVLSFFSSLLVGTAHAAESTSMFTPPDKDQDLLHNILMYLFKGKDLTIQASDASGSATWVNPPSPTALRQALYTTLAYFSTAVLVFAGLILMYHLVVMIAETAHSGVPMGRNANQVWAPIRLVFAIGLLVPISGGLNTGQYLAVQVADWGAGLASNVWATFLQALASEQRKFTPPSIGMVGPLVTNRMLSYSCMKAYNSILSEDTPTDQDTIPNPSLIENGDRLKLSIGTSAFKDFCGSFDLPNPDKYNGMAKSIMQTGKTAFENNILTPSVMQKLDEVIEYFKQGTDQYAKVNVESNKIVAEAVEEYRNALKAGIEDQYASLSESVYQDLANRWSKLGAGAALAFSPVVAHTQQVPIYAAKEVIPSGTPPKALSIAYSSHAGARRNVYEETAIIVRKMDSWLNSGYENNAVLSEAAYKKMGLDAGYGRASIQVTNRNGLIEAVSMLVGKVMNQNNINLTTYNNFTFGFTGDPFSEIASYGHKNIVAAFEVLDLAVDVSAGLAILGTGGKTWGAAQRDAQISERAQGVINNFKSAGFSVAGAAAGQLASTVMTIAGLFATLLFTTGLLCGYFVPLIPFATFFFNLLAWIVSVFESVVSMPLLALAHLTTKGEGLPGDMAKTGYFFLFSIFLRPTLMVFGLIAGILIFYVAVMLLDATYSIAVQGVLPKYTAADDGKNQVTVDGYMQLARCVLNIIYAMLVYICATTCFNTIKFFPEHAMRWMSAQGVSTERMGDKQLMSSAMTGITAYAFKDTVSSTLGAHPIMGAAATKAVRAFGGAPAGGGGRVIPDHADSKDVQRRFDNMIPDGNRQHGEGGVSIPHADASHDGIHPTSGGEGGQQPDPQPAQTPLPVTHGNTRGGEGQGPDAAAHKPPNPDVGGRPQSSHKPSDPWNPLTNQANIPPVTPDKGG